jgi:DNA polymerase IV
VILPIEELPRAILHLKLRDIPGIGPNMAERLQKAGITDIAALWKTDASRLRLIWGGVAGERMHALLHGEDIVTPKHARSSISHQHVLAPDDRTKQKSATVVRQLLVRAAQRQRQRFFLPSLGGGGEVVRPGARLLDRHAQLL